MKLLHILTLYEHHKTTHVLSKDVKQIRIDDVKQTM
jgi:hypothetical protein